MRLKQLEIVGFKSFAQKTVLDFPPGTTAIVGPNGCGKSNVVDSIRWVLGEQSPKHLRGDSMEDVVFKGNERVPPTGMAQVSLTFENDPAQRQLSELDLDISTVPAHFRELTEITITRRYFRSGESEYFINKTPCRLKDITELFLGTGVGSKAYAIIEQGRVEQLINAKPEDRRLFIEEAAGTTLYRSRKLQAERKMERTRENLLRVNDILRELERQIQYLHRMAKKAEQYRAFQDEIRQLDLALCSAQWRHFTAAVAELDGQIAGLRARERQMVEELARLEQDRTEKIAAQSIAEETLARQRETAAVLESEATSLRQRIALLSQEVSERERRIGRLQAEGAALGTHHDEITVAIDATERERSECARLLLIDEADLRQREAELSSVRATVLTTTEQVETTKNAVIALVTHEAGCRNAVAVQTRRRDDAQRRLEKLAAEQAEASQRLAEVEAAAGAHRAGMATLHQRLRTVAGEKEQRADRMRAIAEERRGWDREASAAHNLLVQLQSRLESLQEIQRNYEGYQRGVRSILLDEQQHEGVLGVVADVIDVPQQYERAVAAALGDRLQYVIVRQEDDGMGAVNMLRDNESGRGSFIPLSPRKVVLPGAGAASLNGNTRRLLDVVQVNDDYRRVAETLLGEVVLVPDLDSGLALWRKNGVHVTMVTPGGDVIDATGVITGGSERPLEEGIVSRRRLVSELAEESANAAQRLSRAREELERLAAEMETQETALKESDRDIHTLTLELLAAEKDLERLEGERPRWLDRLEIARFESATAGTEETESIGELQRIETELATATREREALEGALRAYQEAATAAAAQVDTVNAQVTGIKVRVAERRQRHEGATAAVSRFQSQLADMTSRAAAIASELDETQRERSGLRAAVEEADAQRIGREAQRQAVEVEIGQARSALEVASAAVVAHDRLMHEMRDQVDTVRSQSGQCEIAVAEQRLRATHLAESMREKYATDLAEHVPTELTEAEEASLARLEALRDKVARIGEVSVGAIDELKELEERAQFLRTQKDDLERSLADIEKTIQRLNRASRTKFAETFAAVNEKFQAVLPQLFRGAQAHLVLTDEHNLLETGVEIVVRPPGKRLESMTLLSGGEKALVAVSLIFSLFLINPTPFCFLDEVDAPLDDANIGRFTNLVKDMSQRSQFIVITHNKRTMQAADVLYGVTMEEPGISKVISVAMH